MGKRKIKVVSEEEQRNNQNAESVNQNSNNNGGAQNQCGAFGNGDSRTMWDQMDEDARMMGGNCGKIICKFGDGDSTFYKKGSGTIIKDTGEDSDGGELIVLTAASVLTHKDEQGGDAMMPTEAMFYWQLNGANAANARKGLFSLDIDSIELNENYEGSADEFIQKGQIANNIAKVKALCSVEDQSVPQSFPSIKSFTEPEQREFENIEATLFGYSIGDEKMDKTLISDRDEGMLQIPDYDFAVNMKRHTCTSGQEGGPVMILEDGVPTIIGMYTGTYKEDGMECEASCLFSEEIKEWIEKEKDI